MALESAQSQIHVINVAGLLIGPERAALEHSIVSMHNPLSLVTVAPTPPPPKLQPWLANEDPEVCVQRAMAQIEAAMRDMPSDPNVVLVGRSYGAFTALLAACRLKLQHFLKLVLVEGPLHPDVLVEPAPLLPPLQLCRQHYAQRPDLAREIVAALEAQGTNRIVTIANREDRVVPPEAMRIPGRFQEVVLESDDLSPLARVDPSHGVHVVLPDNVRGVEQGLKSWMPPEYRDHLFWSDHKLQLITRILGESLPRELMVSQAA